MPNMVRVKILGGGRQVGKNAILISDAHCNILLDYGVDIGGEEPEFPLHVRPRDLDLIAVTHAHLDHSGALPLLYVSASPKLVSTRTTLMLSELLINDFLKLSKYYAPYESRDVQSMKEHFIEMRINQEAVFGKDAIIRFHEAGHIPGSVMIDLEISGTKILYTGDFNTMSTCLLKGATTVPFKEADIVIMEATYAEFNHPPREKVEEALVEDIVEVLDSGGTVLIPSFAVGRSQEVMCLLAKYDLGYPIFIDGMARKVIDILNSNTDSLANPRLFKKACSMVRRVKNWRDRREALRRPSIIIAPAAMLKGGASVFYMKKLLDDPKNAVFFVSYLIPDTPARGLLLSLIHI